MRQIINRGQSPGDPNGESLYSGTGKINQNFEELYSNFNGFLTPLNITRNGNVFKVPANRQWVIAGVQYTNANDFFFTIPSATTGYKRYDLLAVRSTGFEVIAGTPATGVAQIPDIPNAQSAILASPYYVDGNNVGDGSEPGAGSNYITKISRRDALYGFTGANVLLPSPNAYNGYRLVGTGLISIDGFLYDSSNPPTLGDFFPITNVTGGNVTLNDNSSFITGNLILPNKKVAVVRYEGNGVYRLVASSVVDTMDSVLDASANTTSRKIIQFIPGGSGNGFETNLAIRAGYIYGAMLNGPVSLSNSSFSFSAGTLGAGSKPRNQVHKTMYYTNSDGFVVPDTFADLEIPHMKAVKIETALKANLSGGNIFSGNQGIDGILTLLSSAIKTADDAGIEFKTGSMNYGLKYDSVLGGLNVVLYGVVDGLIFIKDSNNFMGIRKVDPTEQLDVNGNIKTNGAIFLGKFTTGTEPAYEPGKTYYNTSIGKMRIGGATVWETISST